MIDEGRLSTRLGKPLRFLLVGGAFALGYSVATALLVGPAGLPAFATSVLLYVACIPAAFFVQARFTFTGQKARRGRLPRLCCDAGGQPRARRLRDDALRDAGFSCSTRCCSSPRPERRALVSYAVNDRLAFGPKA